MWKYKEIKKIIKDRETEEGVKFLTRWLKKYFHKEDYYKIIRYLVLFLRYAYIFEILLNICIYFLIAKYIQSDIFSCVAATVVYSFQLSIILSNKIEYSKKEVRFLYSVTKTGGPKILGIVFRNYIKENFSIILVVYFMFSFPLQILFHNYLIAVFIYLLVLFCSSIYIYIDIYIKLKEDWEGNNNDEPKTECTSIKDNIFTRVVRTNITMKLFRNILLYIVLIGSVLYIITVYSSFKTSYIIIVAYSLSPALINSLLIKVLTETVLEPKNLKVNYYFFKKYKMKNNIIKIQSKELLKILGSLVVVFAIMIDSWAISFIETLILGGCSLLILNSIINIKINRAYSYEKYDYDDIKSNIQLILISDFFEDYILFGAPTIFLSIFILLENKYHNLYHFILFYAVYTVLVYSYNVIFSLIKRRKIIC